MASNYLLLMFQYKIIKTLNINPVRVLNHLNFKTPTPVGLLIDDVISTI